MNLIDYRAIDAFQELANLCDFRPVECIFKQWVSDSDKALWPQGKTRWGQIFGNAPNYFAGAVEYIRLATGWYIPDFRSLEVEVVKARNGRRVSTGLSASTGKRKKVWVVWAEHEVTLTVLHELIHLFKPQPHCGGRDEDFERWVENQASKLLMGI